MIWCLTGKEEQVIIRAEWGSDLLPSVLSPGLEVNSATSTIFTANCWPVSRFMHLLTTLKGPLQTTHSVNTTPQKLLLHTQRKQTPDPTLTCYIIIDYHFAQCICFVFFCLIVELCVFHCTVLLMWSSSRLWVRLVHRRNMWERSGDET